MLTELLVVMGILAILMIVAVPSFRSLMASTQLTAANNSLVSGLQRARAEALISGHDLVMCPSTDGQRCMQGSDWSNGFLLYSDNNRNGRFDPVEPLLLSHRLDPRVISVRSNSGRGSITYRSLGESAGSNATFVICSRQRPEQGRQIIIANSGRVRSLRFAPQSACSG